MRVNVEGTRKLVECARVSWNIFSLFILLSVRRNESVGYTFDILDNADKKLL
jgi:hypothetical protein